VTAAPDRLREAAELVARHQRPFWRSYTDAAKHEAIGEFERLLAPYFTGYKAPAPPIPDVSEEERVARVIAAESLGLPLLDNDGWEYYLRADEQEDFLRAARAALGALGPATEAEAAVERVRALANEAEAELADIRRRLLETFGVRFRWDILDRFRAAIREAGK
jgi:hypothetical protein